MSVSRIAPSVCVGGTWVAASVASGGITPPPGVTVTVAVNVGVALGVDVAVAVALEVAVADEAGVRLGVITTVAAAVIAGVGVSLRPQPTRKGSKTRSRSGFFCMVYLPSPAGPTLRAPANGVTGT
jgi:hypothetical protein